MDRAGTNTSGSQIKQIKYTALTMTNVQNLLEKDIKDMADNLGDLSKRFSGKTVLISGGAGFLGKHFISLFKYLNANVLEKPVRVISADNFLTGDMTKNMEHDPNIAHVWADVVHPLPVREDIHYIIHAAGVASPVFYMKYPIETIESAVYGAKNLLELARKQKSLEGFLLFSSSEIYGDPDRHAVPTKEDYHGYVSSVGPRACYDESKRLAETLATIYADRFEVPTKIVRPFNVFGPGMKPFDKRVIPMFTLQALNAGTIPVHGEGNQTRTFCYITDAIPGFLRVLLLGKKGQAYNIGNPDNEISMANLARLFVELSPEAKFKMIAYPATYPAGEPMRRCPDLSKAKKDLDYESKVHMREGIQRFMEWAKSEPLYTQETERKEVKKKTAKKVKTSVK